MPVRPALALIGGLLWVACAMAEPIELKTADGQTVITYNGIQFLQIDAGHSRYTLTRGVKAVFKKTGVTMTSDKAIVDAVSEGSKSDLSSVNAVGNVKLVKIDHRPTGIVTSTLTSNRIEYLNGKAGSSAHCPGPVVLSQTDASKKVFIHATGGSGEATFLGNASAKNNRMTTAILHSPVNIDLNQAPRAGAKAEKAHATCSQMIYRPGAASSTLELTGNIHMTSDQGNVSNMNHMTVHLDEKNQIKDFQGS